MDYIRVTFKPLNQNHLSRQINLVVSASDLLFVGSDDKISTLVCWNPDSSRTNCLFRPVFVHYDFFDLAEI